MSSSRQQQQHHPRRRPSTLDDESDGDDRVEFSLQSPFSDDESDSDGDENNSSSSSDENDDGSDGAPHAPSRRDIMRQCLDRWALSAGNDQAVDLLPAVDRERRLRADEWLQLHLSAQLVVNQRLGNGTYYFPVCSNRDQHGIRCEGMIVAASDPQRSGSLRPRRTSSYTGNLRYVCTRCLTGSANDERIFVCHYCRLFSTRHTNSLCDHMSRCDPAIYAGVDERNRVGIAEDHRLAMNQGNPIVLDLDDVQSRDTDVVMRSILHCLNRFDSERQRAYEDFRDVQAALSGAAADGRAANGMDDNDDDDDIPREPGGFEDDYTQQDEDSGGPSGADRVEQPPRQRRRRNGDGIYADDMPLSTFREAMQVDEFARITSLNPRFVLDDLSHATYTNAVRAAATHTGRVQFVPTASVTGHEPYSSELEAIGHQHYRLTRLSKDQQSMTQRFVRAVSKHGHDFPEEAIRSGDVYSRIEQSAKFPRLQTQALISDDKSRRPEQCNRLEFVIARSLADADESRYMRFVPSYTPSVDVDRHHTVELPHFSRLLREHCADGALLLLININTDHFDTTRQNLGISAYGGYFEYANLDYQQRAKKRNKHVYAISKRPLKLHEFVAALCINFARLQRGIIVRHGALGKNVLVRPLLNLGINDQPERDACTNTTSFSAESGCCQCVVSRGEIHLHRKVHARKRDIETRHAMFALNRTEDYRLRRDATRGLSVRVAYNSFWQLPYIDTHQIFPNDILHVEVLGNWRDHHFERIWRDHLSHEQRLRVDGRWMQLRFANINSAQLRAFKRRTLFDLRGWNADHWMCFLVVSPFLFYGELSFDLYRGWLHHLFYYRVLYHPVLSERSVDFAETHWHEHCDYYVRDIAEGDSEHVRFIKFHLPQHMFGECKQLTATCCNANTKMFEAFHSPNKSEIAKSPRTGAEFAFKMAEVRKVFYYHYARFSTKDKGAEWFDWSDYVQGAQDGSRPLSDSYLSGHPNVTKGFRLTRIRRNRNVFSVNDFVRFGPRLEQVGIVRTFMFRELLDGTRIAEACVDRFLCDGIKHHHLCPMIDTTQFVERRIRADVQRLSPAMVVRHDGKSFLNIYFKG